MTRKLIAIVLAVGAILGALGGGPTPMTPVQTYTVTFNVNGYGALRDSEKIIQLTSSDRFGYTCLAPEPMVPNQAGVGYGEFQGWYTTSAASGGIKLEDGTSVTRNVTYYARWTYYRYVVFDPNGGQLSDSYRYVKNGSSIGTLPTPTWDGYMFDGWYTAASGGTKVTSSTTVTATGANITTSLTYYARWKTSSTCTVTFNANGGIFGNYDETWTKSVTSSSQYGSLPTPARSFYTFVGWYTSASGGTRIYPSSALFSNSSHTLYAHWEDDFTTSISTSDARIVETEDGLGNSFYVNPVVLTPGDGIGSPWLTHALFENASILANRFTRNGYSFSGWKVYDACRIGESSYSYMQIGGGYVGEYSPSSVFEFCGLTALVAQWRANTYSVSFNANGGSVSLLSKSVTYDSTYGTLPTPSRNDYSFDGWYTSASGGTKITASTVVSIASPQTLYAHWTGNFLLPDCDPPPYNLESGWGGDFKFYEEADDADGLNLAAWREWFMGDWVPFWFGVGIKMAIPIEGLQYTLTEDDVVLVAGSYSDFGNPQVVSDEWMYQKHYTALKNAIGRAPYGTDQGAYGMVFDDDVRGRNYSLSLDIWPDGQAVAGRQWILIEIGGRATQGIKTFYLGLKRQDVYLYYGMHACEEQVGKPSSDWAHGELAVLPWPIGAGTVTGGGVYRDGDNVTLTAMPAEDGEFIGWYDGDGERWFGTSPTLSYTSPGWNTTIYAVFKQSTVRTITFDANGGSVSPSSRQVELGETLGELPVPEWTGRTFAGWWTSASGGTCISESTTVTGNATYYAHWAVNQYTATFNANGGIGGTTKTQEVGTSLVAPTVTRTGYSFTGWSPPVPSTMPASNTTYKAQWRIKSYLVSFNVQGGSCDTKRVYKNHNAKIGALPAASRESFEFLGWYTSSDGGEMIDSKTVITNDVTFYAHWRQTVPILTIVNGRLTKVEMGPFSEVTIPDGVTRIEDSSFSSCTNLVSVTIPESVTSIGWYAFKDCIGLTSVVISDGVTDIGQSAFEGCGGLTDVTIPESVTSIGSDAFKDCIGLTSVVIPDGVTHIYDSAFEGCSRLTSVTIPESVTSIGSDAFKDCIGLTNITIPDSVTSVGCGAFSGCNLLLDMTTIPGVGLVDGWVVGYDDYLTEHLVLSGIRGIGNEAFANYIAADSYGHRRCEKLMSVVMLDDVMNIGFLAFGDCSRLASVTILAKTLTVRCGYGSTSETLRKINVYAPVGLKGILDDAYLGEKIAFTWTIPRISYGTVVQVYVEEGQENRGAVSGYGAYQSGKTAILKATPKKGYAFAGWYEGRFENGKLRVNEGALLSRSASYEYPVPTDHVVIVARFASTDEDAASLKMEVSDDVAAADGTVAFDLTECVKSLSQPKLAVSGLPAGLKFDAKTMMISGKATKPGVYTVKATATNASATGRNAVVKEFTITVPNFTTPMFDMVGLDTKGKYVLMAGVVPENINDVIAAITNGGWKLAISGLPSGLKYDAKANSMTGIATKEGFCTVYLTATKGREKQIATATFEVVFPTLTLEMVAWGDDSATNKCKVTGGGKYPFGKKVTLKATPAKGAVFVGWHDGDGTVVTQVSSYSYVTTDEDATLIAKFVTVEEDRNSIDLAVDGVEMAAAVSSKPSYQTNVWAGVYMEWPVAAGALSETKVKVAGLPAGLKFTEKPVTSKIGSGKTAVVVTNVPACTIYGAPTAASKTTTDRKTGEVTVTPSAVKVTVTTAGKSSQTYQIDTFVDALPAWAVGTFDGVRGDGRDGARPSQGDADAQERVLPEGLVTLTVTANGKISGKVIDADGTWTLSAASFDSYDAESETYVATVIGKNGKMAITNEVEVSAEEMAGTRDACPYRGVVTGGPQSSAAAAAEDGRPPEWTAWQNLWKTEPWKMDAKPFAKAPALAIDAGTRDACPYPGTITLKFAESGAVTASGKFVTGRDAKGKDVVYSASCSSVLVPEADAAGAGRPPYRIFLYFPPKAGKFEGYADEIRLVWGGTEFSVDE